MDPDPDMIYFLGFGCSGAEYGIGPESRTFFSRDISNLFKIISKYKRNIYVFFLLKRDPN